MTYRAVRLRFVVPGTGLLRLTRVALFAVSAVGLASAAHLVANQDVPVVTALLAVPAVMIVVNLPARRRRGPVGLFLGLGLTQAVLHLAFMVTSIAPGCAPTSTAMGAHGHYPVTCGPVGGHGGPAAELWPSPTMALGHTLATVLLVLLLARGEAALWALATGLGLRPHRPPVLTLPPPARPLPVAAAAAARVPSAVHRRTVRRRGPPVLALADR